MFVKTLQQWIYPSTPARAGSNQVSGLHQETKCYHWISNACHLNNVSFDVWQPRLLSQGSCSLVTYRDTWHNSWHAWQPSHLMSRPRLFASLMPHYSLPKFCRLKLWITLPTFNHLHARMDEMAPGQFVCFPAPGPQSLHYRNLSWHYPICSQEVFPSIFDFFRSLPLE